MSFVVLSQPGKRSVGITLVGKSDLSLFVAPVGLKDAGKGPAQTLNQGAVITLRTVLDLNKHTFQAFADDIPSTALVHDDDRCSSFYGIEFTDGTALGGNLGSTFTAALDDIKVTQTP